MSDNATRPCVMDLFSGCGGMSWGLHKAGFRILAGLDEWEEALGTFRHNHPDAMLFKGDIRCLPAVQVMEALGLQRGQLDCLIGGPPCQGFSKNVPASWRFLEDPRNLLFRSFLDYAEASYPKVVVMENVAEIYNAYDGAVRREVEGKLLSLGYQTVTKVLRATDYGVPQQRRRCVFFASRTLVAPKFPKPTFAETGRDGLFDDLKTYRSAWSAISDLPRLENGEGSEPMQYDSDPQNEYQSLMRQDCTMLYDHITRRLNEKQLSRVASLKPGEGWRSLPQSLQPRSGYSGAYGRLDYELPAPTITRWVFHPGSGRFSHPREARLVTMREAARLQSFSDDFRFLGTYIEKAHQIGNAVPPLLMTALSEEIRACLRGESQSGRQLPLQEAVAV